MRLTHVSQPTIYMKIPGIDGMVTESNHKKWIQLANISFGIKRDLHNQAGHMANREISKPEFSSITISKPHDASGTLLAQESCAGLPKDKIVIHLCKTGAKGLVTQTEITLKDVHINAWHINTQGDNDSSAETAKLSFSHIEIKGYPYDEKGKQQTPQSFAYDLVQAQPA